jgi:hypothetical protein
LNGTTRSGSLTGQVVREATTAQVYKTWEGPIIRKGIIGPLQITIQKKQAVGGWTFNLQFRQASDESSPTWPMPWGVAMYTARPQEFLQGLGITGEETWKEMCSNGDSVNLESDGVLHLVKDCAINLGSLVNTCKRHLALFLDLLPNDVERYVFDDLTTNTKTTILSQDDAEADESDSLDGNTFLMFEIGMCTCVSTFVIGVFTWWVYKRRSKKMEKEGSTVSGQSSSDECGLDELAETIQ